MAGIFFARSTSGGFRWIRKFDEVVGAGSLACALVARGQALCPECEKLTCFTGNCDGFRVIFLTGWLGNASSAWTSTLDSQSIEAVAADTLAKRSDRLPKIQIPGFLHKDLRHLRSRRPERIWILKHIFDKPIGAQRHIC